MPPVKKLRTAHKHQVPPALPDHTWIPDDLNDYRLPGASYSLYIKLLMYEQLGEPFPSNDFLAVRMMLSPQTIAKHIRTLRKLGLLVEVEDE